jgi:hypothetical protein
MCPALYTSDPSNCLFAHDCHPAQVMQGEMIWSEQPHPYCTWLAADHKIWLLIAGQGLSLSFHCSHGEGISQMEALGQSRCRHLHPVYPICILVKSSNSQTLDKGIHRFPAVRRHYNLCSYARIEELKNEKQPGEDI